MTPDVRTVSFPKSKLTINAIDQLAQGSFVEHGVNVLAFGLPGTSKTHALCALGHRLVEAGHSVLFAPAYRLVQDLLAAKRDFALPRQLRKLDTVKGVDNTYHCGGGMLYHLGDA